MELYYFNYTRHRADGWWDRRSFMHKWWRLHAQDSRWTPPYYPLLWRALAAPSASDQAMASPSISAPLLLHLEALPRRRRPQQEPGSPHFSGALMEEMVAATALFTSPQRAPGIARLGLLHCVNHIDPLERLLGELSELLWAMGCRRVIGPTAVTPYLPAGALENYFHVTPPLHTPYNPPYLPDLFASLLEPVQQTTLFHLPAPTEAPPVAGPAQLAPLDPERLGNDLAPLFAAACVVPPGLPPPVEAEIGALLPWLQLWPHYGWLATMDGAPAGFVLLQPDLAPSIRLARGGRNWAWRLWLHWRKTRPVNAGRLVFGGVLPAWRSQGIGRQLWRQALATGVTLGWRALTIGPVVDDSPGYRFLMAQGAKPQQRYTLYGGEL